MSKTLVLYFSKTGTTERIAQLIGQRLGADLYQIREAEPYNSADLDWNNPQSRANLEQGDIQARPAYAGQLPDLSAYDQIIIGHPIWWGIPPRIIETVVENLDFSGKRVADFATSGGSTFSQTQDLLGRLIPQLEKGRILSGQNDALRWLTAIDF